MSINDFDYDLFVIGAGSGGVRAARTAAGLGARVAIAEERFMGGTCVNVGCVPKKLYSYAAHYHYDFEDSRGFGWSDSGRNFDWPTLRDNKQQEIKRLNGIYQKLLDQSGVTVIEGRACISAPQEVQVNGQAISAERILIATGGWPFIPEFDGKELAITSNEIFDLDTFPDRILIVGGGYIAVEFAGIFAGLGASTILSYRGDMPLRGFDEDVRTRFMDELGKHVQTMMGTNVTKITEQGGALQVTLDGQQQEEVDCVLYATGRVANTANLGLENVGISTAPNGTITVDKSFQTNVASIYAIGDAVGKMALTPVALAEGMILAHALYGSRQDLMNYDNIPTAIFSHPNIATVGMSEETASKQYGAGQLVVYESEFRHLRHTLSGRQEKTYMKLIVRKDNDLVLGMHMMGDHAGEIIQGFAAAMQCGLTKAQLDTTIGIHPTAAEEFVTMRSPRT